jgi:gluconolactonase
LRAAYLSGSLFFAAAAVFLTSSASLAQGIPGVLAPGAKVQLVQEGFTFLEGPVGTRDGGLYFSDIMGANRTMRLDPSGKITVVRENTNGANGLALLRDGSLAGAEGDGRRISQRRPDGKISVLTEGSPGMPLLSPNDLIADRKGGIYFTDPGPRPVVPGRKAYVYYLPSGSSRPLALDDTIARPNGLTLTRDGKTLIVDDTIGVTVFAFDVQADGTVKNKRPFAQLHDSPAGAESGADGLALDRAGRVFISTVTGVQVFDATGKYLGTIAVPRQPANVAFAGPRKQTLYITARQGLYMVKTLTRGPDRLGK